MKKVIVFFADGTEEIEALTVVDVLRRAGAEVTVAGVGSNTPTGSHGIRIEADVRERALSGDFDMVVLPGGMPGAKNLEASACVDATLRRVAEAGGFLTAICAAPLVLGRRGYLRGKRAICYPGFESELKGAEIAGEKVCRDGNIITAAGPGAAMAFALALTEALFGAEKASALRSSMLV